MVIVVLVGVISDFRYRDVPVPPRGWRPRVVSVSLSQFRLEELSGVGPNFRPR